MRPLIHRAIEFVRQRWALLLAGAGLLVLAALAWLFLGGVPIPSAPESTKLLAADGTEIASLHGVQDRTIVALDDISPFLRKAVVATEDRSFYTHAGVSVRGIVRAVFTNVQEGEVAQGGSTLTQQYVRNAFASVGRERSFLRKIREAALALKFERSTSKDEILGLYLNTVYYGRGAYGAEAAARVYFAKPARELTLGEAAYVAGVIRSPENLQPDRAPDAALRVRNEVLSDMVANGDITQAEADAAAATPPAFSLAPPESPTAARAAFFVEYVRRLLRSEFGLSDATILGGGLTVETTLDLKAQDAADKAVEATLDEPTDPEVALVAMDTDGHIRAMIGGRDFRNLERARGFNYAYQGAGSAGGRQAGSAFKPFTLAAFLDEGEPLAATFPGPGTIRIDSPQCRDAAGKAWEVSNFSGEAFGTLDVRSATEHSVNTVYAQMIDRITPRVVARLGERVGGWESLPSVCSLALGANSVTPLEMARAFATFAGRGERPTPIAVTRILDADGDVLAEREPETERVLDAGVADTVNDVLQGVISRGTAQGRGIGRPAAGKTGTTQNHVDAWFVGYTPTLATAVWMGFGPVEGGAVPQMTNVRGRRVTGGSFPATIWQSFMRGALAGTREEAFEKPPAAPEPSPAPVTPTPEPGLEPSPTESPSPGYSPLPLCGGVPGLTDDCEPLTPTPTLRPSPTRPRPSPPRSSPSPSGSPEPSPLLPSPSLSPGLLPSPPVVP